MEDSKPILMVVGERQSPCTSALEVLVKDYVLYFSTKPETIIQSTEIEACIYFLDIPNVLSILQQLAPPQPCLIALVTEDTPTEYLHAAIRANAIQVLLPKQWELLPTVLQQLQQTLPCTHDQAELLVHQAERVPGVIYQVQATPKGAVVFPFISDRLSEICDIPLDELRQNGDILFEYMHPDDVGPFFKASYQSQQELSVWTLDYRLRAKGGEGYIWVHGSSKPVSLADGSVLWYGYMEDITQEKEAQNALKASEERARNLFEHAPDAIAILAVDGTVLQWNPKAEELFGWSAEEMVGKLLYVVAGPLRNHEVYAQCLADYQDHGKGVVLDEALELQAVNRRGEEFTLKVAISTMQIQDQTFFSCFMNDITEQKQAQLAVRQSLREKEVLLKEIHHRVKNNLQVITSLLSLQASFLDQPAITDIFRKTQYRINSMGMVHEMLYQSQDLSNIDYREYLQRLVSGLIRAMRSDGVPVTLELSVPQIYLNVDTAVPLGLIINEIVTNSLKYAFPKGEKGTLYIKLTKCDYPEFLLQIGDDGVGYDNQALSQKAVTSLGLSLMRRLTIQLKGTIEHVKTSSGTHYELYFQETH